MVAAWNPWHGRPAGRQGHEAGSCLRPEQAEQFPTGVLRPGVRGWTGQPWAAHHNATARGAPGAATAALRLLSSWRGTGIVLVTSVCPITSHTWRGLAARDRRDSDAKECKARLLKRECLSDPRAVLSVSWVPWVPEEGALLPP
ncbi:hypothetical protein ACE1SV_69520 [Streptomyces sp. E-15]